MSSSVVGDGAEVRRWTTALPRHELLYYHAGFPLVHPSHQGALGRWVVRGVLDNTVDTILHPHATWSAAVCHADALVITRTGLAGQKIDSIYFLDPRKGACPSTLQWTHRELSAIPWGRQLAYCLAPAHKLSPVARLFASVAYGAATKSLRATLDLALRPGPRGSWTLLSGVVRACLLGNYDGDEIVVSVTKPYWKLRRRAYEVLAAVPGRRNPVLLGILVDCPLATAFCLRRHLISELDWELARCDLSRPRLEEFRTNAQAATALLRDAFCAWLDELGDGEAKWQTSWAAQVELQLAPLAKASRPLIAPRAASFDRRATPGLEMTATRLDARFERKGLGRALRGQGVHRHHSVTLARLALCQNLGGRICRASTPLIEDFLALIHSWGASRKTVAGIRALVLHPNHMRALILAAASPQAYMWLACYRGHFEHAASFKETELPEEVFEAQLRALGLPASLEEVEVDSARVCMWVCVVCFAVQSHFGVAAGINGITDLAPGSSQWGQPPPITCHLGHQRGHLACAETPLRRIFLLGRLVQVGRVLYMLCVQCGGVMIWKGALTCSPTCRDLNDRANQSLGWDCWLCQRDGVREGGQYDGVTVCDECHSPALAERVMRLAFGDLARGRPLRSPQCLLRTAHNQITRPSPLAKATRLEIGPPY